MIISVVSEKISDEIQHDKFLHNKSPTQFKQAAPQYNTGNLQKSKKNGKNLKTILLKL